MTGKKGSRMDLNIRPMTDADGDAVVAVWHAAGVARPWNDPTRDLAFARKGEHSTVLVGESGGRIVATAMVGQDGHRGWVYYLAVDPSVQAHGIGRSMMTAVEDWLTAQGVWKIQLLVRSDNAAAKGFYEHLGFHDTGSVCLQKIVE